MGAIEIVGLKARAFEKVKTFSHGMKQRLGIAQALLTRPEMIILDEPTTGLDPQGMKEVREPLVGDQLPELRDVLPHLRIVEGRLRVPAAGKVECEEAPGQGVIGVVLDELPEPVEGARRLQVG